MFKVIKIVGIVLGLIPVVFGALPASADPKKLLIEKDWGAYRYDDSAGRSFFISSVPTESKGKYDPNNRGETRVFVSHGPDKAERNVVQVVAGYRYKPQSDVKMNIDGKKFTLFTIEDKRNSVETLRTKKANNNYSTSEDVWTNFDVTLFYFIYEKP